MKKRRYQQTVDLAGNPYYRPRVEPAPIVAQPDARPYLHTVEAGAELPLIQSVIWGLIGGALALVIAVVKKQWWTNCIVWGAGAFVVTFGLAWLTYQRHWFKLASLEQLLGADIDGDGVIGAEAEAPTVHVRVDEVAADGNVYHSQYFDLPASPEQLRSLAFGILAGVSLAEGHWTSKKSGNAFSKPEFYALRAEFLKRKLVEYVSPGSPAQGYRFTRTGMATLRYICPVPEMKGNDKGDNHVKKN